MPPGDGEKLNRIEELKNKLFSKNYPTKIEHRDTFSSLERRNIKDSWGDEGKFDSFGEKFFMKTSIFKKFFIFTATFFILTLGYAAYMFFVGGNTVSNDNIDISILGNTFTAGGEELPLVIGISNKNTSSLDLVDLVVEYPKGGISDASAEKERLRQSLGTIPSGAVRNENIKVVLFGQQGSIIPVKISIEYRVEGSNAIFVKEKNYEVSINSTPINLSVEAPRTISPNQEIVLNVKATLNATRETSKVLLKLDYPVGFQFIKAVSMPALGNNVWDLGSLAPGVERGISITGKMLDVFDGEEKTFKISSGSQSSTDKSVINVVFNSIVHTVTIKKPFIEAKIFINGISDRQYATDSKTVVHAQIHWTNNLDTKVNDLVIKAKISGNAVNRKTVNAGQGFYDSSQDVVTWDKNSVKSLKDVNPGDSGSVDFSFSPLSLFSGSGGILNEPSINIEVSIKGKQALEGYATEDLSNSDSTVIKIISDVGFAAKAFYYSGAFTNTGPIPPQVEKATSYTIVWSLSNTSNNVSKASIRSNIPPWVRFVGSFAPAGEDLTYNSSTKEIIWNVDKIPKGTSITEVSREVAFQIALTPSLSQVGNTPVIINEAVLTGHDDFANVDVRVNKASLNTILNNDPTFPPSGAIVVE
ncbi:hypothetical protein A2W67_00415 [Candidatus Nomurabacteria bacterium RIFCSPLOWO2_02_40_28]|uniref:DUF11 domain-containing protein n=2 Tax=Candidatus Nomuraibacteriota TaxID=1752729 RepID=A0A837HRF4_9BACT|nr:MAG: hypothetical protein UT27_C0006G0017 [Candidatus Nomurabacteria bacterium GW2011_GWD2_39_12]KKR20179.1 MAG: hypothetical protein UT51_C0007G0033 [Candidatus Nomurabacteria bacterium GW2011_GWC2_39_41]KKR36585.1 MAG: hypothetical protein UT70_C0009G0013 [Candidatus Nomurabacteria bacterium GW2011_GWE2_40_10]KKR38200.1 MAG: hypothetical protein UT73_C0005G0017 [Candidatus Nomurabacteria bacterium GW2011_GWB1_40_11]KKR39933.1 MAG: hypothetical protein UT74_C0004G0016 [Parcubacteria group b